MKHLNFCSQQQQRHAGDTNQMVLSCTSSNVLSGVVLSPRTPSVNLSVCHILLQKVRLVRTSEMDNLMSSPDETQRRTDSEHQKVKWRAVQVPSHSPCSLWEQRENLRASVPHAGIPVGKSFLCGETAGSQEPSESDHTEQGREELTTASMATSCSLGSTFPSFTFC